MPRNRIKLAAATSIVCVAVGSLLLNPSSAQGTTITIRNGGFEDGSSAWAEKWSVVGSAPHHSAINDATRYRSHTGTWKAELGGDGLGGDGFLGRQGISQTVTLASDKRYVISYWLCVTPHNTHFRRLDVTASAGGRLYQLDSRTNKDSTEGYEKVSVRLPQEIFFSPEQRVEISFTTEEDGANLNPFLLDDISILPTK